MPDEAAYLRAVDPPLGRVIDAVGPYRLEVRPAPSLFYALAESILHQQLTGRAAATIFGRLGALFAAAEGGLCPENVLRVDDGTLRAAGLSGGKGLALRDLARRCAAGELPALDECRGLPDEELVQRLTTVRGIGRWTVQMLLIFRLGRPDVLPADDYGVRQGFARAFGLGALPAPRALVERAEAWRPHRTAATWYLWRAVELPR